MRRVVDLAGAVRARGRRPARRAGPRGRRPRTASTVSLLTVKLPGQAAGRDDRVSHTHTIARQNGHFLACNKIEYSLADGEHQCSHAAAAVPAPDAPLLGRAASWPTASAVSARTLRRDVDRLRELGYPVDAQRGVDGGYQLAAGAALPPLVLDDEEAVALAIGLRAAAHGAIVGIEESSVRALAKVVQVMPPRLRRRVEALRDGDRASGVERRADGRRRLCSPPSPRRVATRSACASGIRRVTASARRGTSSPIDWSPWAAAGTWSPSTCMRHDWRSFRLDRLSEPRATGMRFAPRELPAATRWRSCGQHSSRCPRDTRSLRSCTRQPRRCAPRSVAGQRSRRSMLARVE